MTYSISELEQLSGIPTHTIRIWERRYNALAPVRSSGNTRLYDDKQLRRLLNIVSLNQSGLKISNVCALNEEDVDRLLQKEMDHTVPADANYEYYISQIISNGFLYDELKVDQLLSKCLLFYGMLDTYRNVIYPLLVRLGLMWQKDKICPSQEHFLSGIIRQKIFSAINDIPLSFKPKSTWLLFLPEDEDHDIGLLLANYILRVSDHKVIYLGAKVPLDAIKNAMSNVKADNVLLFMTRVRPINDAVTYLDQLNNVLDHAFIHLAGNTKLIGEIELKSNMKWLQNIQELEQTLNPIPDVD